MEDKSSDTFDSKDKHLVPFLLTQANVSFVGTKREGSILYFQFSPYDKCVDLVNLFIVRKAPPVQPKDLLEAIETYRDLIYQMKDDMYGKH